MQQQHNDVGTDSRTPAHCCCSNPGIATTLVGMAKVSEVQANVATVLQAAGLLENEGARAEAAVLQEVTKILADVKDQSWPSGKPENN